MPDRPDLICDACGEPNAINTAGSKTLCDSCFDKLVASIPTLSTDGARAHREEQARRTAEHVGVDGEELIAAADAVWSNLNPQSSAYIGALSLAVVALKAAESVREGQSRSIASKIYDVLIEECGADEALRADFLYHYPTTPEYRFQGQLGFGGKIYNPATQPRVAYYPEDRTVEREDMVWRANQRLGAVRD